MKVLAIDQGTTSTRAFLGGAEGTGLRLLRQIRHRQNLPRPGHVEHDPAELLRNVADCATADVELVALANQGESCLAWDARDGRPISPVIVWQDQRTEPMLRTLRDAGAGPEVMARAGLPLDAYFSAAKLGWILRHSPEAGDLLRQGRLRLGTTDAFFRDHLTDRFETDIATASRTSLMNLETGAWDERLCALFGVPIQALPAITPTAGDLGWLPSGARLVASLVDQQAALFGHGCRQPGDAKVTFGTGAFVQALTDGLVRPIQPGPLPTVAWQLPDQPVCYALDGAVYTAAAAVDWARDLGLFQDFAEISDFAGPAAIDSGLIFLPALAGLACPHWDRQTRGAWFGLSLETGRQQMMQALIEGIALRVAENLRAIEAIQPLRRVSVDGGMARNDYLLRFLAGLTRRPLIRAAEVETTALGLVQMALHAEGIRQVADGDGLPAPVRPAPLPSARAQAATRMHRFALLRDGMTDLARQMTEDPDQQPGSIGNADPGAGGLQGPRQIGGGRAVDQD
ncbi:glycerol kinase [Paracoccus sp. M683]|uniref:FGGY family carbohydrate kinase n=1 Tax=Paracoccus sp. M683 TaxID=2594268 RepID=UPI00118056B0|nr:FGGY family carbohydrate kinase [Paracoccus sp. M683]TRW96516.1 glycerol kinase [Paracoccus sp. M683]